MAAVEPKRVLERIEPLALGLIAAVRRATATPAGARRAQEPIAVPPVARAPRGAAEAEDALVVAIEVLAVGRRIAAAPAAGGGRSP